MICSECKEEKDSSEFYNCKSKKNGKQGMCKPCQVAYVKQWKIDNREQANSNKTRWASKKKNKKKIARYKKRYYAKHKKKYAERSKQYFLQYYWENREYLLEQRRQYYIKNKVQIKERRILK